MSNWRKLRAIARRATAGWHDQQKEFFMYFVYFLRSINFPKQTYIGHTDNLKERLETHNSGGSIHTAQHRPWRLIMYLAFSEQQKAKDFEKYLKSQSGRAFAKKRLW